jgi:hypothetical protein
MCALAATGSALAQERPPVPPAEVGAPPPPPAPGGPPPAFQPGFVDAVGRWFNEGTAKFKNDMQGAQETFDKMGDRMRDAAKDAAGAIALPNARIMAGRERCMPAPNGAPDCEVAARALCKGKGFQAGKTLDTQSERNCSPGAALLAGRPPSEIECQNEMFVTRAMCH